MRRAGKHGVKLVRCTCVSDFGKGSVLESRDRRHSQAATGGHWRSRRRTRRETARRADPAILHRGNTPGTHGGASESERRWTLFGQSLLCHRGSSFGRSFFDSRSRLGWSTTPLTRAAPAAVMHV